MNEPSIEIQEQCKAIFNEHIKGSIDAVDARYALLVSKIFKMWGMKGTLRMILEEAPIDDVLKANIIRLVEGYADDVLDEYCQANDMTPDAINTAVESATALSEKIGQVINPPASAPEANGSFSVAGTPTVGNVSP